MRLPLGRLACLMVVLLLLPGCTSNKGAAPKDDTIEWGFITPKVWQINATTDRIMVWAHNPNSEAKTVTWSLLRADMTALPPMWNVTFSPASLTLKAAGTKEQGVRGNMEYPDWGFSVATIVLAGATGTGGNGSTHPRVEVRTPISLFVNQTATIAVDLSATRVSGPGDRVNVRYVGKFLDNGETFDQGDFPTGLGTGQTVPGFDFGLMGLAVNERAHLVIPPALAYGYDNTDPGYTRFNGRWLVFDVTLLSNAAR